MKFNLKKSIVELLCYGICIAQILLVPHEAKAHSNVSDTIKTAEKKIEKKWYESISLRGYTQIRYNRFLETNSSYKNEQGDRSIGENGGFFLRRIRLIFFGNVHERVYIYIQPDFASSASSTGLHFGQIRDCYFDLSLDKKKEFRIRFGQSKVPYGFENMQSSQNRIALDRNDALNSAVSNERDLGAFFYWAPSKIRDRFATLVSSGLKGSGDYGVFAFGAYNGQTANRPEANNNLHVVTRLTFPFLIGGNQFVESSIQAFTGKTTVSDITKGVKTQNNTNQFDDYRLAGTIVVYPQPFGVQAEYTIGSGPEYDPTTNTIQQSKLEGGYALINYMLKIQQQVLIPFCRYHYYNGGKKFETDARKYRVKELEIGVEWQPLKNFELVANYTIGNRTFEDGVKTSNNQIGNLLRLQAQFNF